MAEPGREVASVSVRLAAQKRRNLQFVIRPAVVLRHLPAMRVEFLLARPILLLHARSTRRRRALGVVAAGRRRRRLALGLLLRRALLRCRLLGRLWRLARLCLIPSIIEA